MIDITLDYNSAAAFSMSSFKSIDLLLIKSICFFQYDFVDTSQCLQTINRCSRFDSLDKKKTETEASYVRYNLTME